MSGKFQKRPNNSATVYVIKAGYITTYRSTYIYLHHVLAMYRQYAWHSPSVVC